MATNKNIGNINKMLPIIELINIAFKQIIAN